MSLSVVSKRLGARRLSGAMIGCAFAAALLAGAPQAQAAPIANPDSAVTNRNFSVGIVVLLNDLAFPIPADPTSVTVVDAPAHGDCFVNAQTGKIDYWPDEGYFGADSFTYKYRDTQGAYSNTTTVSIQVLQNNQPPEIMGFTGTKVPGGTNIWVFTGLVGDDDPVEGLVITFGGLLQGHTATVQADGSFTHTVQLAPNAWGLVTAQTVDTYGAYSFVEDFLIFP